MPFRTVRLAATALTSLGFLTTATLAGGPPLANAYMAGQAPAAPLAAPTGIAFGPNRDAYVVASRTAQIVQITPTGKVLDAWGRRGSAPGQFTSPLGIAVDPAGHVYVSDSTKSRVDKFSSGGTPMGKWGLTPLRNPQGIAVDTAGNVYIADTGDSRIVKMSPQGLPIANWNGIYTPPPSKGKKAKQPVKKPLVIGRFFHPQGVTVDYRGHIFVTDTGHNRIVKLSRYGEPLAVWNPIAGGRRLNAPEGVALDPSGDIWIADTGNDRLVELSPQGTVKRAVGGRGNGPANFIQPRNLAFDAHGNVYVADTGNNRIVKLSRTGAALGAWR